MAMIRRRVLGAVPHGHWKTLTMLGALRLDGPVAEATVEAPTDSEVFRTFVTESLAPAIHRGDVGWSGTISPRPAGWARVSSAFAHFGEEDCLRGWQGSGTIFFSGCNLGCVFCQNFEISQLAEGRELDASQLAAAMLRLQEAGCHNINFVTPEHVVPQILEALLLAIPGGLRLPLVYNTGAYDSLESIRLMEGTPGSQ